MTESCVLIREMQCAPLKLAFRLITFPRMIRLVRGAWREQTRKISHFTGG